MAEIDEPGPLPGAPLDYHRTVPARSPATKLPTSTASAATGPAPLLPAVRPRLVYHALTPAEPADRPGGTAGQLVTTVGEPPHRRQLARSVAALALRPQPATALANDSVDGNPQAEHRAEKGLPPTPLRQ